MADFKDRLDKALGHLGLSNYKIAKDLNISKSTISNYLKGKSSPNSTIMDVLADYLEEKGISRDWLISGNEPMFLTKTDPTEKPIINSNGNEFIELPDGTYDIIVKELPFVCYASYVETLEHGEVYEDFKTSTFNVDKVGLGHYMAFTVKGDSMNGGSINDTPDGAKVLGRELNRHHWKDGFGPTEYGWIILCQENIFHKDIIDLDKKGNITLHSRNKSPEYSDFQVNLNEVNQIFKVIKRIF